MGNLIMRWLGKITLQTATKSYKCHRTTRHINATSLYLFMTRKFRETVQTSNYVMTNILNWKFCFQNKMTPSRHQEVSWTSTVQSVKSSEPHIGIPRQSTAPSQATPRLYHRVHPRKCMNASSQGRLHLCLPASLSANQGGGKRSGDRISHCLPTRR